MLSLSLGVLFSLVFVFNQLISSLEFNVFPLSFVTSSVSVRIPALFGLCACPYVGVPAPSVLQFCVFRVRVF